MRRRVELKRSKASSYWKTPNELRIISKIYSIDWITKEALGTYMQIILSKKIVPLALVPFLFNRCFSSFFQHKYFVPWRWNLCMDVPELQSGDSAVLLLLTDPCSGFLTSVSMALTATVPTEKKARIEGRACLISCRQYRADWFKKSSIYCNLYLKWRNKNKRWNCRKVGFCFR